MRCLMLKGEYKVGDSNVRVKVTSREVFYNECSGDVEHVLTVTGEGLFDPRVRHFCESLTQKSLQGNNIFNAFDELVLGVDDQNPKDVIEVWDGDVVKKDQVSYKCISGPLRTDEPLTVEQIDLMVTDTRNESWLLMTVVAFNVGFFHVFYHEPGGALPEVSKPLLISRDILSYYVEQLFLVRLSSAQDWFDLVVKLKKQAKDLLALLNVSYTVSSRAETSELLRTCFASGPLKGLRAKPVGGMVKQVA